MQLSSILTALLVASASAFAPNGSPAFTRSVSLFEKKTGVVKWYVGFVYWNLSCSVMFLEASVSQSVIPEH